MKVILANVIFFDWKKGLILPSQKKMDPIWQLSYSPPIGLLYIGRSIEDEGHIAEIIDFNFEKDPMKVILHAVRDADAVGLNAFTPMVKDTAFVARLIKESYPNLPIIIGGPHCTLVGEKALEDVPQADIAVVGEGEYPIKGILQSLEGRKDLSEIAGIYYRKNSSIHQGKNLVLIKDLDTIPFPSRHLIDKYEYGKIFNLYMFRPRYTAVVTSRGCPFHCRFCMRDLLYQRVFRKRSVDNVVAEFQEINERYGSVVIADDNFLADTKRAHAIVDQLISNDIDLEIAIGGARVDAADRELFKKMKKAGVKFIFFGIESGNQEILDYYRKEITLDQIRNAVQLGKEMGFFMTGSFILGAPIETEKHIVQSIDFACSLPLDFTIWRQLRYYAGSDIWHEAVDAGKISEKDGYCVLADSQKGLGRYTQAELSGYCKKAYRRFYLRPRYIYQEISKAIIHRDVTIVKVALNAALS